MSTFDNNLSTNHLTNAANIRKKSSDLSKANVKNEKQTLQSNNALNSQQIKTTSNQGLINTNSNTTINQSALNSPVVNQGVLNATNTPQVTLNSDVKNTLKSSTKPTPTQGEFQGAKDLPAYAGIANMSLKSWIAQNGNTQGRVDVDKTQLASLFEAMKGFEIKSYEEESKNSSTKKLKDGDGKQNRRKELILLSNIFASIEQSGLQETELLVRISNFKKLGEKGGNQESLHGEKLFELKMAPPSPAEIDKQMTLSNRQIKHLHELFALPKEFPEGLRLFANKDIEINPQYFKSFLLQRLKIVEEYLSLGDSSLNKAIQSFVPLLNQGENQLLLPLLLLYYPLPLPVLNQKTDFVDKWKLSKEEKKKSKIATCEIYYISKARGRFLIKFELSDDCELSADIQTAKENDGIVKDIELAIEEGIFLIDKAPKLSDLNVLLTKEVYKATDIDEELSIVSRGPLRLEIIIAAYSALSVLNKLSVEIDPSGLIEMSD